MAEHEVVQVLRRSEIEKSKNRIEVTGFTPLPKIPRPRLQPAQPNGKSVTVYTNLCLNWFVRKKMCHDYDRKGNGMQKRHPGGA